MKTSALAVLTGLALAVIPGGVAHASDADSLRVAGADRYETAVAVSRASFDVDPEKPSEPLAQTVFVASGSNFPDGLAASPVAAAYGGPLLLVPPAGLPAKVAAEIKRLKATEVVIAGGVGSVSPATEAQLRALPGITVYREAGVDRYDTARLLSESLEQHGGTVYLASGEDFPDALAAGAVAGSQDVPLLLSRKGSLPSETADALRAIKPAKVVVAGGAGSVSDGVIGALRTVVPGVAVTRVAGADRFETAARLSASAHVPAEAAYLASGYAWADALSGAASAGLYRTPMLLSKPSCVPAATTAEIRRLGAKAFVLVGGPGVLAQGVVNRVPC